MQVVAPQVGGVVEMTFDGDGINDDEANSWEDSVSESEGSVIGDVEYYDEEKDENDDPTARMVMKVNCTEYDVIRKLARKEQNFKLR